jgi:homoserine kinase
MNTGMKASAGVNANASAVVKVSVPATSANLGPGFDCLGLALDLWNEAEMSLQGETLRLSNAGEGQNIPVDERNMVVQAFRFFCDERGLPFPRGLVIRCHNRIPLGSGLGSSASAVLIGLLGASTLLGKPLETAEALVMAARMEGHADNAAAALLGGLTIVAAGRGGWITRRVSIPEQQVALVLPAVHLPTHTARAALPTEVTMQDATFNLSRAVLVVEALRSGDLGLLREAVDDRLHLPYRLPLIPGGQRALEAAYDAGAKAVTISGAGPSLIAFTGGDPAPVAQAMVAAFATQHVSARPFLLKTTSSGANVSVMTP